MPSSSISANVRSASRESSQLDSSKDRLSSQWPLRERSTSHGNGLDSPTIRIVQEPESPVYSKTPFPTRPSHVLLPRTETGFVASTEGESVSNVNPSPAQPSGHKKTTHELFPRPLQPRKKYNPYPSSESTNTSEADTAVSDSALSPSTSWFSHSPTPPTSPPPPRTVSSSELYGDDLSTAATALDGSSIISDSRDATPPIKARAVRAISPPMLGQDSPTIGTADTFHADAFLASPTLSPTSTHAPSIHSNRKSPRPVTVTYSAFPPLRDPPRSIPVDPRSQKRASASIVNPSTSSSRFSNPLNLSNIPQLLPSGERPRSSSSPIAPFHVSPQAGVWSGGSSRGQDRSFTDPSSSGFGSRPSPEPSAPPARMNVVSPRRHQYSSQLSTIASESDRTNSQSGESDVNWQTWRRRPNGSLTSSMIVPSEPSEVTEPVPMPPPLFARTRATLAKFKRDSDEYLDVVSDLQSPPARSTRWGHLARESVDSLRSSKSQRSSRSQSSGKTTYSNELVNSLPSWARTYYRRGESVPLGSPRLPSPSEVPSSVGRSYGSLGRSSRSTSPASEQFPATIYRPRNRPLDRTASGKELPPVPPPKPEPKPEPLQQPEPAHDPEQRASRVRRQSLRRALSSHPVPLPAHQPSNADPAIMSDGTMSDGRRSAISHGPARVTITAPYSPHLYYDHRTTGRLSAWQPPSLDETAEGLPAMSNPNRQILLFCLGFVFPFAWMLASFLPLPYRPELRNEEMSMGQHNNVEAVLALQIDPIDERRYQKARWWRNANRIMSLFGICLICAIIAIAVIATV